MLTRLLSKSFATSAVIVATTGLVAFSASESKAVVMGFNEAVGAVGPDLAYAAGTFTPATGTSDDFATITPTTLTLTGFTTGNTGATVSTIYTFDVTGLVGATAPENEFSFSYDISNIDGIPLLARYIIDGGTPVDLTGTSGTINGIPLNGPTTSSIAFALLTNVANTTNAPVFTITNFSAPGTPVIIPPPTTTPEPSAVLGLLFLLGAGALNRIKV